MSDVDIPPTEEPAQPEPGPGYWPAEWARHIERAEANLAENPPPVIPQPEPEPPVLDNTLPDPEAAGFDPGAHTVAEVEDYVTAHPDECDAVLAAEQAGKNRVTLVEWLQGGTSG